MNERGYIVVNQHKNLTIYRKDTLRPIEVTKDFIYGDICPWVQGQKLRGGI